jgi:hypothetical protein
MEGISSFGNPLPMGSSNDRSIKSLKSYFPPTTNSRALASRHIGRSWLMDLALGITGIRPIGCYAASRFTPHGARSSASRGEAALKRRIWWDCVEAAGPQQGQDLG